MAISENDKFVTAFSTSEKSIFALVLAPSTCCVDKAPVDFALGRNGKVKLLDLTKYPITTPIIKSNKIFFISYCHPEQRGGISYNSMINLNAVDSSASLRSTQNDVLKLILENLKAFCNETIDRK